MSKLIVTANSFQHLEELIRMDIYGVMLYIDKLSVNSSFYIDVDDLDRIEFNNKKIFLCMNKIMHNSDIDNVRDTLLKLKDRDIRILFYDMSVYNIALEYDIVNKLVIFQDHLNASIQSNKFYNGLGIKGSYVTSDITGEELLEIKNNCDMELYFMGYGYAPIFYSRRYLIRNYLKFINKEKDNSKYLIVSDMGNEYLICEEEYGTTIYSDKVINLINYLDMLEDIDYIIMNSNNILDEEFNLMVDKFINRDKMDDCYLGFFDKKTVFKVKSNG